MADPRVEKLAEVIVSYSVAVRPGDKVVIEGDSLAEPLIKAVYVKALQAGGHPLMRVALPGMEDLLFKYASNEQLQHVPEPLKLTTETYDVRIAIGGADNTRALTNVDPARMVLHQQARSELMKTFLRRSAAGELRWTYVVFPTNAYAQDAEMSLPDFEDFVFNACMPDMQDPVSYWKKVAAQQEKLVAWLKGKKSVHVTAPGTDLTLRIDDRPFKSCACEVNVPDGEVFTSPIENSANGNVYFSYPTNHLGTLVVGVRMEFKDGKCIQASAEKNEKYLNKMLDLDEGARFLGEFAIGTNEGITKATGQILFDEKIGGSFHMALGNSYSETLGVNHSQIHWDMICDLKHGGQIHIDDQLVYQDGKFIIEF